MKKINPKTLYNLAYLIRYSNVPRVKDESVAEHSFFVAIEVLKLYETYEFNLHKAISMAICHDFAESEIDDIKYDVKARFPALKQAVKEAEKEVVETYPDYIKELMIEYNDCNSIEAWIVHLADAVQCRTYANNEIALGNHGYMQVVANDIEKRIGFIEDKLTEAEQ